MLKRNSVVASAGGIHLDTTAEGALGNQTDQAISLNFSDGGSLRWS